jgi:hypothetical protein
LTADQISDINGILGVDMRSGQQIIEADASVHQLELIQSVLVPSPNDSTLGLAVIHDGRKQIKRDPNAVEWASLRRSGDDALYIYGGPVPTAKTFARFFVILGVVCATIYIAFAAFSIINGQIHGGNKVIGAAAGVMTLLMGYTIYKVLLINILYKNTIEPKAVSRHFSNQGQVKSPDRQVNNSPEIPSRWPLVPLRSGVPVRPLSGN